MAPTCELCCDKRAQQGACAQCGYLVCRACARKCAVDFAPQCPSCARAWTLEEQRTRLGIAFVTGPYRKARRARLVDAETRRLAGTVNLAVRERERRRIMEALRRAVTLARAGDALRWTEVYRLQHELHALPHAAAPTAAHWALRCGHAECTGWVDEVDHRCTTCRRHTCDQCGECTATEDGDETTHVCRPETVATRRAILANCRPCARCGAPSQRTEGCPTMWCAHCHAFWHWDTGNLLDTTRGPVPHNPDHRAWVAAGGQLREVDDVPCGGLPDAMALNAALMREFARTLDAHSPGAATIVSAFSMLHATQRLRHEYVRTWDAARVGEPLRIRFLLGDMDLDRFGHAVESLDRTLHFKRDVGFCLESLVLAGADVLQRYCANYGDSLGIARELWALRNLTEAALAKIAQVHGRTPPRLQHWYWVLPYQRGGGGGT